MSELIRFHFDPLCPWAWLTSRWVAALEERGVLQVEWALFSLEVVNEGTEEIERKALRRGTPALRTAVAVRRRYGSSGLGAYYTALGTHVHEQGQPIEEQDTLRGALDEAGLPTSLLEEALADDSTWQEVLRDHQALVDRTRSFGVPTIVLDGGDGPAIFGPVISLVPEGDDAVELWQHVAWLTRYGSFAELKRERTITPQLPAFRQERSD